jgi:protein-tyrosine phosphatase
MIDLHCHILPGLDDGPDTMREAIEMARQVVADGIYTLVATPHINMASQEVADLFAFSTKIQKTLTEMRYQCTVLDIPLVLMAGAEVNTDMGLDDIGQFALNGENYVLIEFPHAYLPGDAPETIFNCVMAGFTPIIAHPERNRTVIGRPDRLAGLIRSGALLQINGGSLLGEFGGHAKACADFMFTVLVDSAIGSVAGRMGGPGLTSHPHRLSAERWCPAGGELDADDLVPGSNPGRAAAAGGLYSLLCAFGPSAVGEKTAADHGRRYRDIRCNTIVFSCFPALQ